MPATSSEVDTLRLATAGSVDDGKSTLIGRLLYDSKSILADQLEHIAEVSHARNGNGHLDLALLTMNGDRAPITGRYDVTWLADKRIARGGCLIEGRDRIVDGRVDTALERAYRKMARHDA